MGRQWSFVSCWASGPVVRGAVARGCFREAASGAGGFWVPWSGGRRGWGGSVVSLVTLSLVTGPLSLVIGPLSLVTGPLSLVTGRWSVGRVGVRESASGADGFLAGGPVEKVESGK